MRPGRKPSGLTLAERQKTWPSRNRPCVQCGKRTQVGRCRSCARGRTLVPCPRCGSEFWPWAPTASGRQASHAREKCDGCILTGRARAAAWRAKRLSTVHPTKMTAEERAERGRVRSRAKYARARESEKQRILAYKKRYPEKNREWGHRRRVKIRGGIVEKVAPMQLEGRICFYCSARLGPGNATLDHLIAVRLGGPHVEDNLVPCCSTCNSRKGALDLVTWTRQLVRERGMTAETEAVATSIVERLARLREYPAKATMAVAHATCRACGRWM